MATFINSTALAALGKDVPVNLDEVIEFFIQDLPDGNNVNNSEFNIVFVKADPNGAGTPVVWRYLGDDTQRDADFAAIVAGQVTSY